MSTSTPPLVVWSSSGTKGDLFASVLPPSQTGQGPLQLQSGISAQEDVEEGVQQGVQAGQTVAEAIGEENGTLQSTGLISQQQGHKSVSTHEVIGSKHDDEVDGDHDQDAHDFAPLMVRKGRRSSESHPDVS